METRPSGERVALQDGDAIYLAGDGASETGDRPFLDRFVARDPEEGAALPLRRGAVRALPRLRGAFAGAGARPLRVEDRPPEPLRRGPRLGRPEEAHRLPATRPRSSRASRRSSSSTPGRTGCRSRARSTCRRDTPPATRLPALVWAYPLEYSDGATAGQVRGSTNTFPRVTGASPARLPDPGLRRAHGRDHAGGRRPGDHERHLRRADRARRPRRRSTRSTPRASWTGAASSWGATATAPS